nr:hypothetical protein [Tanacetum cinerariifolium]
MIDYALWEGIKNGATLPKTQVMEGVTTVIPITTIVEKAQRRLEVKAKSTLMMGVPNEHQLKFNSIKDAKQLLKAVEKRFGGNAATKKTQRNLLKRQYENLTASNSEMLDQTFDRLQKLVSQLELLDEKLLQEDVNQKLLRINTANGVSTASIQVNVAFSTNIDNLTDDVICLFFASQPSNPQLVHEDLELIHPDDMEEIDLRWQMAMLTMRARRFLNRIGRKLTVNGNKIISFDKYNVECYNCHKRGHFARECRAPRNQDYKHNDISRKSMHVETTNSTTLIVDNCKKGLDYEKYNVVPPPYIGNFMPPIPDLYFTGLDEFANKPVVENSNAKSSEEETKAVRKNDDALIIEERVSDNKE